jgi:hypothetical protein
MKKRRASSKKGSATPEKDYKTVDQAFAYYFPQDKKPVPPAEGRESGSELAEHLFQKLVNSKQ